MAVSEDVTQKLRGENGNNVLDNWSGLEPKEKWRIIKNLIVLSVAFMIHFTAFFGSTNLQSSINADQGLGTAALVALYAALIVSNIFLPALVIRWLGCKWAISLSVLTYIPYILAQFYPVFATLVPGALIIGLGGGPLWCAKCTYLTVLAEPYAAITGTPADATTARFFGIFFAFFPLSQVLGNFISSMILTAGEAPNNMTMESEILYHCGADFCPSNATASNPNLQRPPDYKINTLFSVYLVFMVLASVVVALFLDPLTRYQKKKRNIGSTEEVSGFKLLLVTVKLLAKKNQLFILPVTVFYGMSQAFLGADFTQAYVGCAWGIGRIGFVLTVYGLVNAVSTSIVSWVVRWAGRPPVVGTGLVLWLGTLLTLLLWTPSPEAPYAFYILVTVWACGDSTFSIVNALYGIVFPGQEEAAYSNFRLWEAFGLILTYSYSTALCAKYKVYIMLCVLVPSALGYVAVEISLWRRKRRLRSPNDADRLPHE